MPNLDTTAEVFSQIDQHGEMSEETGRDATDLLTGSGSHRSDDPMDWSESQHAEDTAIEDGEDGDLPPDSSNPGGNGNVADEEREALSGPTRMVLNDDENHNDILEESGLHIKEAPEPTVTLPSQVQPPTRASSPDLDIEESIPFTKDDEDNDLFQHQKPQSHQCATNISPSKNGGLTQHENRQPSIPKKTPVELQSTVTDEAETLVPATVYQAIPRISEQKAAASAGKTLQNRSFSKAKAGPGSSPKDSRQNASTGKYEARSEPLSPSLPHRSRQQNPVSLHRSTSPKTRKPNLGFTSQDQPGEDPRIVVQRDRRQWRRARASYGEQSPQELRWRAGDHWSPEREPAPVPRHSKSSPHRTTPGAARPTNSADGTPLIHPNIRDRSLSLHQQPRLNEPIYTRSAADQTTTPNTDGQDEPPAKRQRLDDDRDNSRSLAAQPDHSDARKPFDDPFIRFAGAYDDYEEGRRHFEKMCYEIEALGKNLHKSLWDDYIVRNVTDYEETSGMSYKDFYDDCIEESSHQQRIMNPTTLQAALAVARSRSENRKSTKRMSSGQSSRRTSLQIPEEQHHERSGQVAGPDIIHVASSSSSRQEAEQPQQCKCTAVGAGLRMLIECNS